MDGPGAEAPLDGGLFRGLRPCSLRVVGFWRSRVSESRYGAPGFVGLGRADASHWPKSQNRDMGHPDCWRLGRGMLRIDPTLSAVVLRKEWGTRIPSGAEAPLFIPGVNGTAEAVPLQKGKFLGAAWVWLRASGRGWFFVFGDGYLVEVFG
jgi:hypothetical protein